MSDEKVRIEQEVGRLKELAKSKGAIEIGKFYLKSFRHYPSWQKTNPDLLCSLVTDVEDIGTETLPATLVTLIIGTDNDKISRMKFKLKEKDYVFSFRESPFETPDGERHVSGLLELYQGNQKILGLKAFRTFSSYDSDHQWGISSNDAIEAFKDGDWTNDFREFVLKAEQERERLEERQKEATEKNRLEKLKQNFGLP